MKLNFKGKTAVVTGASGGMGLATVDKMCLLGMKVLMIDLKEPPKKYIKNSKISFIKVDVTNFNNLIINFFSIPKIVNNSYFFQELLFNLFSFFIILISLFSKNVDYVKNITR